MPAHPLRILMVLGTAVLTISQAAPMAAAQLRADVPVHRVVVYADASSPQRPVRDTVHTEPEGIDTPTVVGAVLVGGLGGSLGLVLGVASGVQIEHMTGCGDPGWCGLAGGFFGGAVGESVGLTLGVRAATGGHASFLGTLLTAGGIFAIGVLAAGSTHSNAVLVTIPIVQLAASISMEHASRRRDH